MGENRSDGIPLAGAANTIVAVQGFNHRAHQGAAETEFVHTKGTTQIVSAIRDRFASSA